MDKAVIISDSIKKNKLINIVLLKIIFDSFLST